MLRPCCAKTSLRFTFKLAALQFDKIFLRCVAQNVAAPAAVMFGHNTVFFFCYSITVSDFCLCVNPTVVCGYVVSVLD
jgi:hypothetical protein